MTPQEFEFRYPKDFFRASAQLAILKFMEDNAPKVEDTVLLAGILNLIESIDADKLDDKVKEISLHVRCDFSKVASVPSGHMGRIEVMINLWGVP